MSSGGGSLAASHVMAAVVSTMAPPKAQYQQVDWATHKAIMHEMGQDGTEGEGYVNTSKSWSVNAYLRTGGSMSAANEASDWWLSENQIKQIIKRVDSQMKPLTRNIQAVRFVGPEMLSELGIQGGVSAMTGLPKPIKVTAATAAQLQQMIQSGKLAEFTPKAYSSFSTDAKKNVFTSKQVKINYKISKGTPCIMTANATESEGVLARKVKHKITGVRWVNDAFGGKLEIDVTV